jgi:hypothetical protein
MGQTEFEIDSKETSGDGAIQTATGCSNVIALGWNPEKDGIAIDIGIRLNDTAENIVTALGSCAANVFATLAKGDVEKEMHMTAAMMEAIADRQAKRFTMDDVGRFRNAGNISSVTS